MKLSKCGICSRSEGTSVEPSRAGSRIKWVLSKMMVMTCWTFPRGELSWQLLAELAGVGAGDVAAFAVAPAAAAGPAHAGATGYSARSNAVPMARAWRCWPVQTLGDEPLLPFAKSGSTFM